MYPTIPKPVIDLCRATGERRGFVVGVVKDQDVYQIQHALPASVATLPPDVVGAWARARCHRRSDAGARACSCRYQRRFM